MNELDNVVNKILMMVESISKTTSEIRMFMNSTKETMPDTRDVRDIKDSIGRSEKSLVTHLSELDNLVKTLHSLLKLPECLDGIEKKTESLGSICPQNRDSLVSIESIVIGISSDVTQLKQDLENTNKSLDSLKAWALRRVPAIVGIIVAILIGISYYATFVKLSDWVVKYNTQQDSVLLNNVNSSLDEIKEKMGIQDDNQKN